ncbi:hypothetical protein B9Q04_04355 [Candidatus Marsarchaeota G2 archaeon BE_D]|uniref:Uncharacterized protein n=1 Tax=Candidatus Marsarchaeota G2 archaeon BE_D TaxID=1978158 RepID=A0A2R6CCP6_9ARCH|nr:MAG: hypothetical protein B9Q04_04355 [Candidatus Marsarchaeota G2 archaeon BE_D]
MPEKREGGREYVVKWDLSPPEVEAIVVAVKGVSVSAAAIDLAARKRHPHILLLWLQATRTPPTSHILTRAGDLACADTRGIRPPA